METNYHNQKLRIGLSQQIKLAWLDFTVQRLYEGQTSLEIKTALNELLNESALTDHMSPKVYQKKIGILLKIWVNVPPKIESFRNEGLMLLERVPENERIALHWGMTMTVYPFFARVAEIIGRLLRLQNDVSMAQLQKRLSDQMGERKTASTAARQLMRSWVDWGLLMDTNQKNIYVATKPRILTDSSLTTWLLESALRVNESQSAVLHTLVNYSPALFPFRLSSSYFIPNERLELFNQGVNEVNVTFKPSNNCS